MCNCIGSVNLKAGHLLLKLLSISPIHFPTSGASCTPFTVSGHNLLVYES